jgi:hypothetical protein
MNTINSVHSQISTRLRRLGAGRPVFPSDFKGMGSEASIKVALGRLEKAGRLNRLARGIYAVPKVSKLVGPVPPTLEEIAEAVAERDKARIRPAGAFALNKLGLSTQVPMKLVYITDGAPRTINIGKRSIKFKPASPRNFAYKGVISGLVVQAFKELGQKDVTDEMISKVEKILAKEKREVIMHDAKLAPHWIASILYKATKDAGDGSMAKP